MAQTRLPAWHRQPAVPARSSRAEFNAEPHVRGTTIDGAARGQSRLSGDSQFVSSASTTPRSSTKQYTPCGGKVTLGMENVDKIKRGEPVKDPDKIVKAHMALDAGLICFPHPEGAPRTPSRPSGSEAPSRTVQMQRASRRMGPINCREPSWFETPRFAGSSP